jgi:hypothetical protein
VSDEKPPEKPTVKMETVPDWAVKLSMDVKTGFAQVDAKIDEVKADVALLSGEHKGLAERVLRGEKRQDEVELWRARSSERAKMEEQTRSQVDMEHQAQLVHIEERFKAMTEAQTNTIVSAMTTAAKTPQGQKVLNALVGFIVVALTVATGWLMAHGGGR